MKDRRQILTLAAASALAIALALPAASAAEYYVPPANSAANQYTESFPGAGGESSGKRDKVTPGAALGAGNAKRLQEKGPAGREAAEFAAETAPPQQVDRGSDGGEDAGRTGGDGRADESGDGESGSVPSGNTGSNGSGGDGKGAATNVREPQGSSGLGQVLGQATGVSDGNLGLWLPLAIVLTLIGSIAYWVRARHAQPGHRA